MNADERETAALPQRRELPHICVCICTFKRPQPLRRLLDELAGQETGGLFTYSVAVADNDEQESGRAAVEAFRAQSPLPVVYCVEAQRGIARTRNRVLANAAGDYLALIDDDELPIRQWLLHLYKACNQFGTDGILGPVVRRLEGNPPRWLEKSRFFERPVMPTGRNVEWVESRTGNVLLKKSVVEGEAEPFRPDIRSGEDQDFFKRKCQTGFRFTWCAEAVAFEVIPPERWTRIYQLRRALLSGAEGYRIGSFGTGHMLKSILAVPLYALLLPFLLLLGQHRFMDYLARLCEHLGRLLAIAGIHLVRGAYTTD
jgi:glycosyltransferase involved in cell wall biosynthesis